MPASLALVHHANQYLITEGYDNREGLGVVLDGLTQIIRMHRAWRIPFNLHISGTLLEAAAWHRPGFLDEVRAPIDEGLVEMVGSCYGQNIMRFFGAEYNRRQLKEELHLYERLLRIHAGEVKTFWPPERVWDTRGMSPALRDATLPNGGYRYVILDDRLLLSRNDEALPRAAFDTGAAWSSELYRTYEIDGGFGLVVFPISTRLRRAIPPRDESDRDIVRSELEALLVHAAQARESDLLAVYADDMEKVAGLWGADALDRYGRFLEWLADNSWIQPVLLAEWAGTHPNAGQRTIERGTFAELACEFDAGEGYEKWYLAPDWAPYRRYFEWSENRVRDLAAADADEALLELARKQLLVANWETAWHTPAGGPHGDPSQNGHASPWARALTSHSRHAAVIAEAAHWMRHKDHGAHAELRDLDNDGEQELILKNGALFAVISPGCGGRLVALCHIGGERGTMVVGNPCDDWNWQEELNRYMDVPPNHPGAFADVGLQHERYEISIPPISGDEVRVILCSEHGLLKKYSLAAGHSELTVKYTLPPEIGSLAIDFALSPDYLCLLREGQRALRAVEHGRSRGCATGNTAVWVTPDEGLVWADPSPAIIGHACMFRILSNRSEFTIALGAGDAEEQTNIPPCTPELEAALL